jgi:ABC-2 type transport system permease protein
MNIVMKEFRFGLKPFLFWLLGMSFLLVAGMTKYTAIEGGADITAIFEQFPKIILAVLGMGGGVDITSLGGYYTVLMYYSFIVVILYSVYLGTSAVNRELIDKTYEFIFTKPRTRSFILMRKVMTGIGFLVVFCMMNIPLSFLGLSIIKTTGVDTGFVYTNTLALLFVGLVFFALGVFWSATLRNPERGATATNLCFLAGFIAGIIYDMYDEAAALQAISPLRFFTPQDLLDGRIDPIFAAGCLMAAGILMFFGFRRFERRDLLE